MAWRWKSWSSSRSERRQEQMVYSSAISNTSTTAGQSIWRMKNILKSITYFKECGPLNEVNWLLQRGNTIDCDPQEHERWHTSRDSPGPSRPYQIQRCCVVDRGHQWCERACHQVNTATSTDRVKLENPWSLCCYPTYLGRSSPLTCLSKMIIMT